MIERDSHEAKITGYSSVRLATAQKDIAIMQIHVGIINLAPNRDLVIKQMPIVQYP